jgi:hypothetical protein
MKHSNINRRQLLVSAATVSLGTFIPASGAQRSGQEPGLPFLPKDSGQLHADRMSSISSILKGENIRTKDGLLKIVDLLLQMMVIKEPDARVLRNLINVIFSSPDPGMVVGKIEQLYKDAVNSVGGVTVAILSIALNSVTNVKDYAKGNPQLMDIVARDVLGALTGATIGEKFGPALAVVGALAGAVAGSAEAALGK